ncbi:hypothetical protein [Actinokineospora sp.]|uniref:hypothetical protein n=1 Tax=Actinokineospora sp. TaxID=1872133 RepID=UPI004037E016
MNIRREPVLVQTALLAAINLVIAFGILDLSAAQQGALTAVLAAVLGLITRRLVTPLNDPKDAYLRQLAAVERARADEADK